MKVTIEKKVSEKTGKEYTALFINHNGYKCPVEFNRVKMSLLSGYTIQEIYALKAGESIEVE